MRAKSHINVIRIGKITLSAKGITDEITDNHPIDICSVCATVDSQCLEYLVYITLIQTQMYVFEQKNKG